MIGVFHHFNNLNVIESFARLRCSPESSYIMLKPVVMNSDLDDYTMYYYILVTPL